MSTTTTETKSNKSPSRKVSFTFGTQPPNEASIAVTISRFEVYERQSRIYYHIDCWQYPTQWTVCRRYQDFESLHKSLLELVEDCRDFYLPSLPPKRWFEATRWINRFDPEYTKERQQGLQAYLRRILKIPNMLTVSKDLQQFLNIVKLPERVITDDMKAYLEYKRNNIIYYPPEQDDEEGKLEPQYGSGSRFRVQHREGKLLRSREEVEEEARRYHQRRYGRLGKAVGGDRPSEDSEWTADLTPADISDLDDEEDT